MSQIKITLDRDGGYKDGEIISGMVEWQHVKSKKNKPMKVNLLYYTSGRGTKDVKVVERLEVPSDLESAAFSFPLTAYPPSFTGSLISVHWAIEAYYPATKKAELAEFVLSKTGDLVDLPEADTESDQKVPKFLKKLLGKAGK